MDVKRPSINVDVGQPSSTKIQCTTSLGTHKEYFNLNGHPKVFSQETTSGFIPMSKIYGGSEVEL